MSETEKRQRCSDRGGERDSQTVNEPGQQFGALAWRKTSTGSSEAFDHAERSRASEGAAAGGRRHDDRSTDLNVADRQRDEKVKTGSCMSGSLMAPQVPFTRQAIQEHRTLVGDKGHGTVEMLTLIALTAPPRPQPRPPHLAAQQRTRGSRS
eukprot:747117-Hanusia_phi.AAC.12